MTTPDPAVSAVKHKVVEVSRRRVLVGVHTKFGMNSFCRFANVGDFETLVTDAGLSARDAHRYSALGPDVLRV
jgi:DeoR/GlpR family transcriptional regulator of sugar metabolism